VLSREEEDRFDEIARRIDQDTATTGMNRAPILPIPAVIPVRLAALALLVVGVTGVLTGLARSDAVVLAVVGILPAVVAMLLGILAGTSGPASPPPVSPADGRPKQGWPLLVRFWLWLTTCVENGCGNQPVHLGWCSEHAPGFDPGPDEYWGDEENDLRRADST
jgi:hypothetical protein